RSTTTCVRSPWRPPWPAGGPRRACEVHRGRWHSMRQVDEERRLAVLREEVRHLAAGVGDVRRTLWRTFGVLAAIGAVAATAFTPYGMGLCAAIVLAAISAGFFSLFLAGLAELLIGGCRAQLRRRLE